ncbi:MAG: uroporphyrinogen-III C-methyltransferase [Candidatus Sulfotelmatobacter sp.]
MMGKVYLVGAGPGDPDLLTVKALRLLRTADAVLYDDLVSREILNLVSPSAQIHNVGKRCGKKNIQQAEINFLMITLAESGQQVVRLKSGDPMIFGRAGEEIESLRHAGISYEIVPGVTSALGAAAAAEIPLTHRRMSSAVVFLTAHQASGREAAEWSRLASSGSTLVIYMPGRDYTSLSAKLRAAQLPGDTPCAVISRASTSQQQAHRTTIAELPNAPHLDSPTLLVVGDVVRLANLQEIPGVTEIAEFSSEASSIRVEEVIA